MKPSLTTRPLPSISTLFILAVIGATLHSQQVNPSALRLPKSPIPTSSLAPRLIGNRSLRFFGFRIAHYRFPKWDIEVEWSNAGAEFGDTDSVSNKLALWAFLVQNSFPTSVHSCCQCR